MKTNKQTNQYTPLCALLLVGGVGVLEGRAHPQHHAQLLQRLVGLLLFGFGVGCWVRDARWGWGNLHMRIHSLLCDARWGWGGNLHIHIYTYTHTLYTNWTLHPNTHTRYTQAHLVDERKDLLPAHDLARLENRQIDR